MPLHLIKLCVGVESIAHLSELRSNNAGKDGIPNTHITRQMPKRRDEILDGGSLYWVIKGQIQARQSIIALDEVKGRDGLKRCAIVMEGKVIPTVWQPRRGFQGWRYLKPEDAPADLVAGQTNPADIPEDMRRELQDLGLL